MKHDKKRLTSNAFVNNIAIVMSGSIVAKAIVLLSTPIITRFFSPEDYGIYSIFVSILAIVGSLVTLRYAVTTSLAPDEQSAENIVKLSLLITTFITALSATTVFFFGEALATHFSVPQVSPYLWVLPAAVFASGCYQSFNAWAVRQKQFALITRTTLSQAISSTSIKLALGALAIKPLGLLLGMLVHEAAGIISLLRGLLTARPQFFKSFDWPAIKKIAWRYRKFPLVQSWSQLLLALGAQLPVLLVGYYYGLAVAGVFGLAQGMINMPMTLIGQSVAQVYYAQIAKYGAQQPDKIYKLSVNLIKKMFIVGCLPVSVLVIFGPKLFNIIFGENWSVAGEFVQVLSIIILARFISTPVMSCMNVLEIQGFQLLWNIVRVTIVLLTFYTANYLEKDALIAVAAYSVIISVFYAYLMFKVLSILKNFQAKLSR